MGINILPLSSTPFILKHVIFMINIPLESLPLFRPPISSKITAGNTVPDEIYFVIIRADYCYGQAAIIGFHCHITSHTGTLLIESTVPHTQ